MNYELPETIESIDRSTHRLVHVHESLHVCVFEERKNNEDRMTYHLSGIGG